MKTMNLEQMECVNGNGPCWKYSTMACISAFAAGIGWAVGGGLLLVYTTDQYLEWIKCRDENGILGTW
jgi:hypothetical protein